MSMMERSFQNFNSVVSDKEIDALAADLDFAVVNLENEPKTRFTHESLHWNNGFLVPDIILNADYIVSTCCLKTHANGGIFTMSIKLGVGIIPLNQALNEMHSSPNIRDMIAEINLAYRPQIIIMDGVKAFIDGGPSIGTEVDGNVMVAGTDRVAVDAVGVAILKELGASGDLRGSIFEQDQIRRATELGLGIRSPRQIEFVTPDETSRAYAVTLESILEEG